MIRASRRVSISPIQTNPYHLKKKLVDMQNKPIKACVSIQSQRIPKREADPFFLCAEFYNSQMGYLNCSTGVRLYGNITQMGNTLTRVYRYNATTGFSARKGFCWIHLPTVALMKTIPNIPTYRVCQYPVVFRGGGLAGRAGRIPRGLRFASSSF
jgi:hypothetical protein